MPTRKERTIKKHPQETVLDAFEIHGIPVELIHWQPFLWCGFSSCAPNDTDEPDIKGITEQYRNLPFEKMKGKEENWDACLSFNYLSGGRPRAVAYAILTDSPEQPCACERIRLPEGVFLKISLADGTAAALRREPWHGGIPPYSWILDQIAPEAGYVADPGDLPIVEYYGFFDMDTFEHKYRYLYVPVNAGRAAASVE